MQRSAIKAVLGPTNTGKTHLAIERMVAHSSGCMGFPLRLLAREVYDRVRAIKGDDAVALITGEERIEPKNARYMCCTAEAMPRDGAGAAFVALDEAQIGADRERGHIFTDRLLNTRGREETMLLGAATLEPLVRQLIPEAEISDRPRFSTLTHIGPRKLSRLPPRSAIVAFSTDQVYAVAEMLRRFRGGAAVVMGALSPETRNKQVALFQSGEVDYIVATDAIGMGLNLDVNHVAFAGLTKFDGVRMRRLLPAEMAQIAGRAGRHQRDGTFGTLSGMSKHGAAPEFTEEEVYAIEEHRFAPLTHLFWRDPEPRFDSLAALIADLETPPDDPVLRLAPEAIDLATLKRLADEPAAAAVRGPGMVRRFWEACSLPDFRQRGPDVHARFVARLWQDLGRGYIGADYVAARISELDNMSGDIDTLQGRIAAIRSWAYICQRPDWVLARDEMAARARAVEAKLSDALHARLTERFVNRRTAILMKSLGQDAGILPIEIGEDGAVTIEGEALGQVEGLRFSVDPAARHEDRRMLLAAAEKGLPKLLGERAEALAASDMAELELARGAIRWKGQVLAQLEQREGTAYPLIKPAREITALPEAAQAKLVAALESWLAGKLAPLEALEKMHHAASNPDAGSQARALLLNLIAGHGYVTREQAGDGASAQGDAALPAQDRRDLRRARHLCARPAETRHRGNCSIARRGSPTLQEAMLPVIGETKKLPSGYRHAGTQAIRIDLAEKILRAAHETRAKAQAKDRRRKFVLDYALPVSIGLEEGNIARLLGNAGFRVQRAQPQAEGQFGPPRPDRWEWRPSRRKQERTKPARTPRRQVPLPRWPIWSADGDR